MPQTCETKRSGLWAYVVKKIIFVSQVWGIYYISPQTIAIHKSRVTPNL